MGTRGLIGFISKGKKKGQYNHWDSYPVGLGLAIMRWLRKLSEEEIQKMIERVEQIEWVEEGTTPPKELQDRYAAAGFSQTHMKSSWGDASDPGVRIASGSLEDWYNLLYNVQGAKCLPFILNGSLTHLIDGTPFEEDALFCEWAYWIDFERRTLEVKDSGNFVGKKEFKDLDLYWAVELQNPDCDEEELEKEVEGV